MRDIIKHALYRSASGFKVVVVGFFRHNKTHLSGVLYLEHLEVGDSFDYVMAGDADWWNEQGFELLDEPINARTFAKLERVLLEQIQGVNEIIKKKTPARGRGKKVKQ